MTTGGQLSLICRLRCTLNTPVKQRQETTNATKNNKGSWNQLAVIVSKYLSGNLPRISCSQTGIYTLIPPVDCDFVCKDLSGNNLPRTSLIRGKLFPDRYLHSVSACWLQLSLSCGVRCVKGFICIKSAVSVKVHQSLPAGTRQKVVYNFKYAICRQNKSLFW